MQRRAPYLLALPLAILGCALFGGLTDPRIRTAAAAESDDDIRTSLRRLSEVLAAVEENYADKIEPEKTIFQGAIPTMLRALDPHSSFLDPQAFDRMREDHRGRYAGVGMLIQLRKGRVVVLAPFPKTPAYRVGLRPGDLIVEIGGTATEGLSTNEVAALLRGAEGGEVAIGYERPGVEGLTHVTVVRDSIPRPSVPAAFEVRPNVGFVKIETFNENTGEELDRALDELGEENLEGLILDLRGNGGGLLNQGVSVSDKFLERGQMIVSHHGRASSERSFKAQKDSKGEYPIVVMVNCRSASASEIVAGALQDHDRALIVGSSTFGKGLVQQSFAIGRRSAQAALLLTTARYYTPSGRLIQRRYDGVSRAEYYNDPCAEHYEPSRDEVRLTDQGREVFGGGGITPDVPLTERRLNEFQIRLRREFAFENFAQQYTLNRPNMPRGWEATEEVVEEFRRFLLSEDIEFTDGEFIENKGFVRRFVKREVYVSAYDLDEGERVYYSLDPDVEEALEALPQAKALLEGEALEPERLVAEN